jgi:hypothetical protein
MRPERSKKQEARMRAPVPGLGALDIDHLVRELREQASISSDPSFMPMCAWRATNGDDEQYCFALAL